MDNKLLQLAFGIYHSPKVYALLLGSGISRSSGIPTGWEILLDLISKMATLQNATNVTEYDVWYREHYGQEPNYSEILQTLGKTPTDRNNILRSYFEQSDGDREKGIKSPTKAHRAIASLIKRGYIRVILTTNFDRLLEDALKDEGIIPDVISTQDQKAIDASTPLEHPGVTIVKIHGDYRDWRSLNTFEELGKYSPDMTAYLERIFERFGLIVCGWSAEWDTALRDILERIQTKRFAAFWAAYEGKTNDKAQKLVTRRAGQILAIKNADDFFSELNSMILGLENSFRDNPLSISVAVERVKRYVASSQHIVELEELIRHETEIAFETLSGDSFRQKRDEVAKISITVSRSTELHPIFQLYANCIEKLINVIIAFTWYDRNSRVQTVIEAVERLSELIPSPGNYVWDYMPSILLFYGIGIAYSYSNDWEQLQKLFENSQVRNSSEKKLIVTEFGTIIKSMNFPQEFAPLSVYLYDQCKLLFKSYIPSPIRFSSVFDLFEMIVGLTYLDNHSPKDWMPQHSTLYSQRSWSFLEDFWGRAGKQAHTKKVLARYAYSEMRDLLERYCSFGNRVRHSKELYDSLPYFVQVFLGLPKPDTV